MERAGGATAHPVALDVSEPGAVDRVADAIAEQVGRIDIVVANAGFTLAHGPSLADTADDDWDAIFAVNVAGVFTTCRAALRHMPEGGAIVTVGSINAFVAWENDGAYTASKGAVLQLTRALAVDLAARRIRVELRLPGGHRHPADEGVHRPCRRSRSARGGLRRRGAAEPDGHAAEIANCILFLASDEASFVTGAALVADGGTTIRP